MRSQAILLFVLLLFPANLFAQEYGPHAKIFTSAPSIYSGTVIESPEDTIKVITCWHGIIDAPNLKTITAEIFCPTVGNTQLSAKVQLAVIKFDKDKDILLLSGPNTLKLKIKRLKIGNGQLLPNVETKSYGYTELSTKLIVNDSRILDYNSTSVDGSPILYVQALAISGMSGGGLLRDEVLYGVQSVGSNNMVGYCPSDQILLFLKEK